MRSVCARCIDRGGMAGYNQDKKGGQNVNVTIHRLNTTYIRTLSTANAHMNANGTTSKATTYYTANSSMLISSQIQDRFKLLAYQDYK